MFRVVPHRLLIEPKASLARLGGSGRDATAELKVDGLLCSACARRVQGHLERVDGVSSARVDLERGEAHVTYDATCASPDALVAAVEGAALFRPARRLLARRTKRQAEARLTDPRSR